MDLREYRIGLDDVGRGFRKAALPVLRASEWDDASRRGAVAKELASVVRDYRSQAADVAGEFMVSQADGDAFIPDVEGYPDSSVTAVLKESRSVDEVADSLGRHVESAARRQVVRATPAPEVDSGLSGFDDLWQFTQAEGESAPDGVSGFDGLDEFLKPDKPMIDRMVDDGAGWGDLEEYLSSAVSTVDREHDGGDDVPKGKKLVFPKGFARVLSGAENCPFCVMLVSRGPIYSSASKAGAKGVKNVLSLWKPGDDFSNSYHNHCDCMVVPVYDLSADWPGRDQQEYLQDQWGKVTKNYTAGSARRRDNDKLKAWAEYLKQLEADGRSLEIADVRAA